MFNFQCAAPHYGPVAAPLPVSYARCCHCSNPIPIGWFFCSVYCEGMSRPQPQPFVECAPLPVTRIGPPPISVSSDSLSSRSSNSSFGPSVGLSSCAPVPVDLSAHNTPEKAVVARPFAVAVSSCQCCGKSLDGASHSATCSKRCEWMSQSQCPQCGRAHRSDQPYCSIACASQSHQANWCPTCGVRQILCGSTHCSASCESLSQQNMPIRPRKKVAILNHSIRHETIAEKECASLLQSVKGAVAESGIHVVNVVKCTPHTVRRKAFLTYRAHVEQQMNERRSSKYGYGGEGNEQRRFIPLRLKCSFGPVGTQYSCRGGIAVECCEDSACAACVALRCGASMERMGTISHYCTSDLQRSIMHCCAMEPGQRLHAVAICRAVIGVPSFVSDPSEIVPGIDGSHCTVITAQQGQSHSEGTYLFRDDAIDIQYIVLFEQ